MPLNETLKAISDPVRRQILQLLKEGSMYAGEIASHFQISDAAISRHLSVLKKAGLVRSCHCGKYIRYELNVSVLEEIILWVQDMKGEKNVQKTCTESLAEHH